MKLATIRIGTDHHLAVVTNDGLVDLAATAAKIGYTGLPTSCWTDPVKLFDQGPEGLQAAAHLARRGRSLPLDQVELGAPIPCPRKLILLAGNYAEHIMEGGRRLAEADKATPRIFMKPPSTTIRGPHDTIPIPPVATFIDWEAELALVIGRRCKAVKAADAADVILGYTILNDISERELKLKPRPETREIDGFFDWLNGKWLDGFAPMGPWLTTADEVPDPYDLPIELRVNGAVQQSGNTGQMIFHSGDIIEYLSAIVTLEPGDVIATGTCAGVGHAKGIRLQPGDEVSVSIGHLGQIVNGCVASPQ